MPGALEQAILDSLDGLLRAFELEPFGHDRFRVVAEPARFDRIFGGQTVAQALLAASITVDIKDPHSLHAYFVEAGMPGEPLDLAVERIRDGRSIATRRVTVRQDDRTLLTLLASFHTNPPAPVVADPPPVAPAPEQVPRLQQWAEEVPAELRAQASAWIDRPPPVELRMAEPPTFLGGMSTDALRAHWMRLPRGVGEDPLLHTALLAYASDYLLLDMAFRSHPEPFTTGVAGFSLDHAVWFHRPVQFDRWHLHSQRTLALTGHRALVRGAIHDDGGNLVATVMQEVLVRPSLR